MNKLLRRKHLFLAPLALTLFVTAGLIHMNFPKPMIEISKQESALNLNQDIFKFFSLGNKMLMTDLLWIQTLIESDIEHYAQKDLNSWLYLRFLTISQLDPYFYQNYSWGGQYLSIIKDDVLGAVNLLEKGIIYYPKDYKLLSTLGFTYYYEMGDYKNGSKYLEQILDYPQAPSFYKSLVSKMKLEQNHDYDAEILFLQGFLKDTEDKILRAKLQSEIYAVKAEKDLICLNRNIGGCERVDAYGNSYFVRNGKYHSREAFRPYRLRRQGDSKKDFVTTFE